MQKKINPFTAEQLALLKSNFSKIGRKHDVSASYVARIASGEREVRSTKAKKIYKSLTKVVTALS